jgi:hypothetical protein
MSLTTAAGASFSLNRKIFSYYAINLNQRQLSPDALQPIATIGRSYIRSL